MTKVLIVDDLSSIREFLKINLSSEPDIEVVGLADNGKEAITQAEKHQPDIILMDINMPGAIDGIQATERIVTRFPESKVLLLTSQDDRAQLDRALKAGSRGYILKNTSIKDIVNIIRLTEKGFFQIGPIVGNWDGSLHNAIETSASKLSVGSRGLEKADTIIPYKFEYSAETGTSEMNHTISERSSELFQLQETIKSQKDTIASLTNQYSLAQQEINSRLRRGKVFDKSLGFTIYGSGTNKNRKRQQHLLFIISFFLGVFTVLILVMLIAIVNSI